MVQLDVLTGQYEKDEQWVHINVGGVLGATNELTDGLDVFSVHLKDQQQLPLGHMHFAFIDREVTKFCPSAV